MLVVGSGASLVASDLRFEIVVIHLLGQPDQHLSPNRFRHEDSVGVVRTGEFHDLAVGQ